MAAFALDNSDGNKHMSSATTVTWSTSVLQTDGTERPSRRPTPVPPRLARQMRARAAPPGPRRLLAAPPCALVVFALDNSDGNSHMSAATSITWSESVSQTDATDHPRRPPPPVPPCLAHKMRAGAAPPGPRRLLAPPPCALVAFALDNSDGNSHMSSATTVTWSESVSQTDGTNHPLRRPTPVPPHLLAPPPFARSRAPNFALARARAPPDPPSSEASRSRAPTSSRHLGERNGKEGAVPMARGTPSDSGAPQQQAARSNPNQISIL